jgi:hypothetical protein
MFLDTTPAQRASRMRLARRQRIEGGETLDSHARNDRLHTPRYWIDRSSHCSNHSEVVTCLDNIPLIEGKHNRLHHTPA